jgi:formate dehydrogenase assembly factor FdhD
MRTPVNEPARVAGFCLAEGILDSPDDIETIASRPTALAVELAD